MGWIRGDEVTGGKSEALGLYSWRGPYSLTSWTIAPVRLTISFGLIFRRA